MKQAIVFLKLFVVLFLVLTCFGCDNRTKEELLREGVELRESQNIVGAIVMFKNALEKDPNYYEARHELGLTYLVSGQLVKAEKELEKVFLQNPGDLNIQLELAELHIKTGHIDAAIAILEPYLQAQVPSPKAYKLLGEAYVEKGDVSKGEKHLKLALQLDTEYLPAYKVLAKTYLNGQRWSDARKIINEAIGLNKQDPDSYYLLLRLETLSGKSEAALKVGRQILAIAPQEIRAAYFVGLLELQRGELEAASALASGLRSQHGDHPTGTRLQGLVEFAKGEYDVAAENLQLSLRQMSDLPGRYFLGLAHYKLEQYELALNQFQSILDSNPDHHKARLMVALTLFQQKRYTDSEAAAELLLAASPDNALAYDVLGSIYLTRGDFDRGMAALDQAVKLDPHMADVHLKKGLFSLSQGQYEMASGSLEEAVRIAPGVLNSRLLLASSHLRRQNFSNAIKTLNAGLQGKPTDALLYNYLAAAYLGQEKKDEAVTALQQAKKHKPEYLAPYVNLANNYLANGEADRAAAEYQAFLKIVPDNLRALISLASLQEMQGQSDEAKANLEKARLTGEPDAFLASARYYLVKGDFSKALQILQKGQKLHPEDPALLAQYGQLLLQMKRGKEALQVLRLLADVQPTSGLPLLLATLVTQDEIDEALNLAQQQIARNGGQSLGYLLLADIYARQSDFAQATETLQGGLKKVDSSNQQDLPLYMKLADYYQYLQRPAQAQRAYESVHKLYPEYVPAIFSLGALHDRAGDKKQAKALYFSALEKDSSYVPALNNLAYLYADNYGNLDEALRYATLALRRRPAEAGIMDTLGYVLVRQKRFSEALPYLEKAAQVLSAEPLVQIHLGQAYFGNNQAEKAQNALQKALAGDIDKDHEQQVKALLQKLADKG